MGKPAVPEGPVETAFEKRAARAEILARGPLTAAEPLRFACGLYRVQGRLATTIESLHAERPLSGRLDEDADRFVGHLVDLLRFAADQGPPAIVADAERRQREQAFQTRSRLLEWWNGDGATAERYLSRALLRPYVEVLAHLRVAPDRLHGPGQCPFCGGGPWIAVRREDADGGDGRSRETGARRLLGCSLCGAQWPLGRILCPACDEGDPVKLPSFQSERYPAARIEACETCRRYVKSIDLTVDGRAIPEVDDLLSLSMDLWAAGEGFTRIEPGLAGV